MSATGATPTIDTATAHAVLREDGIVQVTIHPGVVQSLADARENMRAAIDLTGGKPRPLLVDISRSEPLSPEARHHYTGPELKRAFTAMAIIIGSGGFGRILGNIFLRVAKPDVPSRLFVSEDRALAWLVDYVA